MGAILMYGKRYIEDVYAEDHKKRDVITIQEFNLFGDPETALWTESPISMTASHRRDMGLNEPQTVTVIVTKQVNGVNVRIPEAKVCLYKESEIFEWDDTDDNGIATFDVTANTAGVVHVTVTKQNHIPVSSTISATECCYSCLIAIIIGIVIIVIIIWRKRNT